MRSVSSEAGSDQEGIGQGDSSISTMRDAKDLYNAFGMANAAQVAAKRRLCKTQDSSIAKKGCEFCLWCICVIGRIAFRC